MNKNDDFIDALTKAPGLNGFEVQTKPNTEAVLAVRAALDAQRNRDAAIQEMEEEFNRNLNNTVKGVKGMEEKTKLKKNKKYQFTITVTVEAKSKKKLRKYLNHISYFQVKL